MALYMGSSKRKLSLGGVLHNLNMYVISSKLKSFDDYVLKDKNDLFLIAKDGEKLWR